MLECKVLASLVWAGPSASSSETAELNKQDTLTLKDSIWQEHLHNVSELVDLDIVQTAQTVEGYQSAPIIAINLVLWPNTVSSNDQYGKFQLPHR